ncbi:MAG: DHHA1 domain-containing protein [Pyrinomonadaceae bacterium]
MNATERLYYTDSHLTEFEAHVTTVAAMDDGRTAVTLDRTAFYPTGGGQPDDTGYLNEARVVECIDLDESEVWHVIEGRAPEVGARIAGRVDWPRRFDHIQQHTGQHILSQAFVELFKAETRGFRMMERVSEIDVALDQPSDARVAEAVWLANRIVWSNKTVRVHQNVAPEEIARMNLRKEPQREGLLRVIEIEGFDMNACGGTHAQRTGEVGLIAVRSWERAKGMTRVEFVAGGRALTDYNEANQTARSVAALFSVGRDEAFASATRQSQENKQLARRIAELEEVKAHVEAEALRDEAVSRADGVRLIARVVETQSVEHLKRLARALIADGHTIALLGSPDKEAARLVFARSSEPGDDMNALMREACAAINGRGGGRADFAQGGGSGTANLADTLDSLARRLLHN